MDTSTPRWFRIGLWKSALWAASLAAAWLLLSIAFGLGSSTAHAADDDDKGAPPLTKGLLGAVVNTLDDVVDVTVDTVDRTTETVTETVEKTTEAVSKTVSKVPIVGEVAEDLKITKTVEKAGKAVSGAVTDVVTIVDDTVDQVVGTVGKVADTVDDVVETVVTPRPPESPATPQLPEPTAPDTTLPISSDESTAPTSPSAPPADTSATGGTLIEDAAPVAAWVSWRTAGAEPPASAVAPRGETTPAQQQPLAPHAPVGLIALCVPTTSGLGSSASPFGADAASSGAPPFAHNAWLRGPVGHGPQPPPAPPAAPDVSPD